MQSIDCITASIRQKPGPPGLRVSRLFLCCVPHDERPLNSRRDIPMWNLLCPLPTAVRYNNIFA